MTLNFLRNIGPVVEYPSIEICLLFSLRLDRGCVFGWSKTTGVKCHFYVIISSVMIVDVDLDYLLR